MNLGAASAFCDSLRVRLEERPPRPLALVVDSDERNITNAAFLLGEFMIMVLDSTPQEVEDAFSPIQAQLLSFRDVSPGEQNFHLQLIDCWEGLWRAKQEGLVNFTDNDDSFDREEYAERSTRTSMRWCGESSSP
jgi:hypothetical protein